MDVNYNKNGDFFTPKKPCKSTVTFEEKQKNVSPRVALQERQQCVFFDHMHEEEYLSPSSPLKINTKLETVGNSLWTFQQSNPSFYIKKEPKSFLISIQVQRQT